MIVVNFSELRKNLKDYGEKAVENKEEIFISRRDKKNLVLLSVDNGIKELNAGVGVHHLIEVDDEDEN